MKIVACVKQVPDSEAKLVIEAGQVSWGEAPLVINPWDEYAVEAALQQKEALGGNVTVLSVGGPDAKVALKHALAMGADEALLISDPALANLDTQAVAQVLAAAIRKLNDVGAAFFGRQAIDDDSGITPAQTGRLLGWPVFSSVSTVKVEGNMIRVERSIEEGRQIVSAKLPAVISVAKDFGEPRLPSFLFKRKADKATIPTWSLAELGLPAPQPIVAIQELLNPPAREVHCEMITASNPEEIAEKLADKILAEKVL